jgi:hypothetical protein
MYTQTSLAQAIFLPSCSNAEPTLDDMLADPIVDLLMSSDRVRPIELQRLLQSAKRQYGVAA